jgi:hypothetical protein
VPLARGYPYVTRDLGTSVYWGGTKLTLGHTCTLKNIQGILPPRHEQSVGATLNRDAQEVMEGAQIFHGELMLQSKDHAMKERNTGNCQDDVIHIEKKVHCLRTLPVNEQRSVGLRPCKTHGKKVRGKPAVLGTRGLFQSIKRLVEATDKVGCCRVNKTCGLTTVYRF